MMKTCPICGTEFPPEGKHVYCSPTCAKQANIISSMARKRQRVLKQRKEWARSAAADLYSKAAVYPEQVAMDYITDWLYNHCRERKTK